MNRSKFSETQIVAILREGEAGVPVAVSMIARFSPGSDRLKFPTR